MKRGRPIAWGDASTGSSGRCVLRDLVVEWVAFNLFGVLQSLANPKILPKLTLVPQDTGQVGEALGLPHDKMGTFSWWLSPED